MKALIGIVGVIVSLLQTPLAAAQEPAPGDMVAAPAGRVSAPIATKQQVPGESPSNGEGNGNGIGLPANLPQYGSEVSVSAKEARSAHTPGGFEFHGYLRAPLRLGLGAKNDGSGGNESHSPPHIPDLSYSNWRYLSINPGPWSELFFSYSVPHIAATVSVASYNQTIGGYRDLAANQGINQAFVSIKYPSLFGRLGGVTCTVGAFSNRYGTAGKSNAGMYQTYLFGRTKVTGETLTATFKLPRKFTLTVEHGFGGKIDAIPFFDESPLPEYSRLPDYLPSSGPVPQGSTFVHHLHLALGMGKRLTLAGHYLKSWTPDDNSRFQTTPAPSRPGWLEVFGAELRFSLGRLGDGYLGYSQVNARNVLPLAGALEILHTEGGSSFRSSYLRARPRKKPDSSGDLGTVLAQYQVKDPWLGVSLTLFGMASFVESRNNSHDKLKLGVELGHSPLSILGAALRYDLVSPNLADDTQSFSVLSPRLILKAGDGARAQIVLQYSRYFERKGVVAAYPYSKLPAIDRDAFLVQGSIYW